MEVIILAGGLGTRLQSEVRDVPKCMAPVANKPFLWHLLNKLKKYHNITRVILSVGYLRNVIFDYIPTIRNDYPFEIDYSVETYPLGTGGGIKFAMQKTQDDCVVVINGDTFFDVNLNELVSAHQNRKEAKLTIALKPMKDFNRYGTVSVDADFRVLKFNEKKPCTEGYINGGVYVLSKDDSIFDNLPEKFSFETEVMYKKCGENGFIFGVVQDNYFIDIGIPEDYHKANIDLLFKNETEVH